MLFGSLQSYWSFQPEKSDGTMEVSTNEQMYGTEIVTFKMTATRLVQSSAEMRVGTSCMELYTGGAMGFSETSASPSFFDSFAVFSIFSASLLADTTVRSSQSMNLDFSASCFMSDS